MWRMLILSIALHGCAAQKTFPVKRTRGGQEEAFMPPRAVAAMQRAVVERTAAEGPVSTLELGEVTCGPLWFQRCVATIFRREDSWYRAPWGVPSDWAPLYRIRTWEGDWIGVGIQLYEEQAVVLTEVHFFESGAIQWIRHAPVDKLSPLLVPGKCWVRFADDDVRPFPNCEHYGYWAPFRSFMERDR